MPNAKGGAQAYLCMLGQKVEDRVTGFKGVVTSVSFDLYGCVQCIVDAGFQGDKQERSAQWFDHKRLKVLDAERVMPLPEFAGVMPGEERGGFEKPLR